MNNAEGRKGDVEAHKRVSENIRRDEAEGQQDRGVTFRAILFGLYISVAVSLLANTVRYVMHGSFMAYSQMPIATLILFLLSILGCAALARWLGDRFVFSPTEWITVFCMGFIAAYGPTFGISGPLIGVMATPYYFATPENQWAEYLHPHLPSWLIPTNEGKAMTWFYEGLPEGASIPWGVWLVPLFWWFSLFCALGLAFASVSILIHRQWSEHEKLVYPAIAPIVEIATHAGTGGRALPEFMKGKGFWTGFSLTSLVFGWNMISWFYPNVPIFPTARGVFIGLPNKYPPLWIFLSTYVLCFSYFASLEVLFSIWFFDLLFIVEGGTLNRLGVAATTAHSGTEHYLWQTTGAFTSLVLWWLWISRLHLREVFRKALHPGCSSIDDHRGLLSYRGAFIGLLIGCLYVAAWFWRVGMQVRMIVVFIPAMFLIYLGLTKLLAESGLVYIQPPTSPGAFSLAVFGRAEGLVASTYATLGISWFAVYNIRAFPLTLMAHINRLGDFVPRHKRRLFGGICAAFIVAMVTSTLHTIWLGYTTGGFNHAEDNWLLFSGWWSYERAVSWIKSPRPMETTDCWFFLTGAGGMVLQNLMRYRFTWWPFHPIGFALSGTSLVRLTSTTIFLAWLIKFLTIKVGGASFYRRSKPFFIGMLIGYVLVVAAGVVVDAVWFPKQGHIVHQWY